MMFYFLALLCLSISPSLAKLNTMPSEVLGFWRLLIATILLSLFLMYKKNFVFLRPHRQNFWVYLSGFFFFLHLWTFKSAAKSTLIANMTVLYASNPIWASIGGVLFFKERPQLRTYISYLLALTAILFLVFENLKFDQEHTRGNLLSVLSAFLYAAYMLTGKKARTSTENSTFALHQYGITALCFFLASLTMHKNIFDSYSAVSWLSILGLIIFPTFLGHFLLTSLVKKMDIAILTCGKLIEPVLASLWAYFIFHEGLSSSLIISFFMITVSVFVLFWPQIIIFTKLNKRHQP
jgi:drug/metabolite transporter (DMT)-like permease